LPMRDAASLSELREEVRRVGVAAGLSPVELERMAVVATELGSNQLRHASFGEVAVRPVMRGDIPGIEIVAADTGPGIPEPEEALLDKQKVSGSLHAGLAAVLRLSDEVDFDIRLQEGTCIQARKFTRPPLRRREYGILGRPCSGEEISGDDACFLGASNGYLAALADGLGHGDEAREASSRGIASVLERTELPLPDVLQQVGTSLDGTRGAALLLTRVDESRGVLGYSGAGDVLGEVTSGALHHRLHGAADVLGLRGGGRHCREEQLEVKSGGFLLLFSDGVSSRASLEEARFRDHPILIAARLMREFGKSYDDATVLIART
jgi:anti-sigma regulatory factor (Ser/Thr protein kinase)